MHSFKYMTESQKNYYILTGTPGTGKTTLIDALRRSGKVCVNEPARLVLREQLAMDGPALPSKSPELFVQAMLERLVKNYSELKLISETVFFDRGIPDLIAYAVRFGVPPTEFEQASMDYRYNTKVFLLSPWKDIFVNDDLRRLSFEASLEFHASIVEAYEKLGYQLIDVPFASVHERMDFILGSVKQHEQEDRAPSV